MAATKYTSAEMITQCRTSGTTKSFCVNGTSALALSGYDPAQSLVSGTGVSSIVRRTWVRGVCQPVSSAGCATLAPNCHEPCTRFAMPQNAKPCEASLRSPELVRFQHYICVGRPFCRRCGCLSALVAESVFYVEFAQFTGFFRDSRVGSQEK